MKEYPGENEYVKDRVIVPDCYANQKRSHPNEYATPLSTIRMIGIRPIAWRAV